MGTQGAHMHRVATGTLMAQLLVVVGLLHLHSVNTAADLRRLVLTCEVGPGCRLS